MKSEFGLTRILITNRTMSELKTTEFMESGRDEISDHAGQPLRPDHHQLWIHIASQCRGRPYPIIYRVNISRSEPSGHVALVVAFVRR